MKSYTFMSKSSACEVTLGEKYSKGFIEGRIFLRFFPLEEGGRTNKSIMVKLSPDEAYAMHILIPNLIEQKRESFDLIYHKFDAPDGAKIHTIIKFTYTKKNEKEYYGLNVSRKITYPDGEEENKSILLPLSKINMYMFADFMGKIYYEACWKKRVVEEDVDEESEVNYNEDTDE